MSNGFLPISKQDLIDEGFEQLDFVYVCGDAYVDHPSFGHAIIARMSLYPYSECRGLVFWYQQAIWTPW